MFFSGLIGCCLFKYDDSVVVDSLFIVAPFLRVGFGVCCVVCFVLSHL